MIILGDMVTPRHLRYWDRPASLKLPTIKFLEWRGGVIQPRLFILDNPPCIQIKTERNRNVVELVTRSLIAKAPYIKGYALVKRFSNVTNNVAGSYVEP